MLPSLLIVLALPAAITARAAGPDTSQTIRRLEQDWFSAMKSADTAKMDQIIADDWLDWSPNGARVTKAEELKSFKSGESKMSSYAIGPVDVIVVGTIAIAQGSDTEKSSYRGKDTSGKWVWTDVFVKRDGEWQAVRSQTTRVAAANP